MNPHYPLVAERAGHRCEYCHAPEVIFNVPFEVEHIIPLAKDGADHQSNFALACRSCNLNKSFHIDGIDPTTSQRARLFHPRKDSWAEHFYFEKSGDLTLNGLTPIGRATVAQLKINSRIQCIARKKWFQLGLFP
jgi:hypothetical protein